MTGEERSVVSPAWLGQAVEEVLERLTQRLVDMPVPMRSAEQLEQAGALYDRMAACWRTLGRHTGEWVVWKAMHIAAHRAEEHAATYRRLADSRRSLERRRAELRARRREVGQR